MAPPLLRDNRRRSRACRVATVWGYVHGFEDCLQEALESGYRFFELKKRKSKWGTQATRPVWPAPFFVRRWQPDTGWQPPLRTPAPVPIPDGVTPEQLRAVALLTETEERAAETP